MKTTVQFLAHAAGFVFRRRFLGHRQPFIGGLVVNDRCNLNCRMCRVGSRDGTDVPMAELARGMDEFRRRGIRSLFFVGGEPMIWRDGDYRIDDLLALARKKGFWATTMYTNGTLGLDCPVDTLIVSIDGLRETNDKLRGSVYDKVMAHLAASSHPNIVVNTTLNSENADTLEEMVRVVDMLPNVRGQYFYFHTPYYGFDELYLDLPARQKLIRRLETLKHQGYRILNSAACLGTVYQNDWPRPSELCCVFHNGSLISCCRANGGDDLCEHCGYMGYPELQAIINLRPSALAMALRTYLPRTGRGKRVKR